MLHGPMVEQQAGETEGDREGLALHVSTLGIKISTYGSEVVGIHIVR